MRAFPNNWNPEAPGSRFSSRATLAILTRRGGDTRYFEGEDKGPTDEVIKDALDGPLDHVRGLGDARAIDASYGRGAAGWVPVIEWTVQVVIGGIVGNAAWAGIKEAAQQLIDVTDDMRQHDVEFLVSRGSAALLAIDHVLRETDESDVLDVEAVEEPSGWLDPGASELSFVGAEPWLVSLLNSDRSTRYIVAVSPSGEVQGLLELPVTPHEAAYLGLPDRALDSATAAEADYEPWPEVPPDLDEDGEFDVPPRDDIRYGLEEVIDGSRSVLRGIRNTMRTFGRRAT